MTIPQDSIAALSKTLQEMLGLVQQMNPSTLSAQPAAVRKPAFRISGAYGAQVPLGSAVFITASAAIAMSQSVDGLVVEVEPQGLGDAYLARLAEVLAPRGIQVKPLL